MPKHCEYMSSNGTRCKQNAKYGIDWILKMCKEHKTDDMKYFFSKKRCAEILEDNTQCTASNQGNTKCKNHNGGKRCSEILENGKPCPVSARHGSTQGKTDKCTRHYGGKRCSEILDDGKPCPNSAQGSTTKCIKHRGGTRCSEILDDGTPCSSIVRSFGLCSTHGGGKRCSEILEDGQSCKSLAKGKTGRCASHGGGKRCVCGKHLPTFGHIIKQPTHCVECKTNDMTNVISKKCRSNDHPYNILCETRGNKYYEGFCARCYGYLFPDTEKASQVRKKSKELAVVHYVNKHFEGFYHDKPLCVAYGSSFCPSKRRIDLYKLINGTMLCIEIDENQHKSYNTECEDARKYEIYNDFESKYVIIRYNPDKYKDASGRSRNPFVITRMDELKNEINKQIDRIKNEENTEIWEEIFIYFDVK